MPVMSSTEKAGQEARAAAGDGADRASPVGPARGPLVCHLLEQALGKPGKGVTDLRRQLTNIRFGPCL